MSGLVDSSGAPLSSSTRTLVGPDGAPLPAGERICLACGCTERDACPGGCAWADPVVDICTRCDALADPYLYALAHALMVAPPPSESSEGTLISAALDLALARVGVDRDELLAVVEVLAAAAQDGGE